MQKFLVVACIVIMMDIILIGCVPREKCATVGNYRCHKNTVQYCATDDKWHEVESCDSVTLLDGTKQKWQCCVTGNNDAECVQSCER